MTEHAKHVLDWAAVGAALATIAQWLPSISALFSIIWLGIRIWESKTVQDWRKR